MNKLCKSPLEKFQNTKDQSSMPSGFREEEFEVFLLSSYVQTSDPRGGATFDPGSIIWRDLVKVN